MILTSGGQGTRLGLIQPKGLFPIGPISQRTLFQMHCDRLLALSRRYQVSIPLFIMTSPATDAATRAYFEENDRCGLAEEDLIIFCQGSMPAVDAATGKILMATTSNLAALQPRRPWRTGRRARATRLPRTSQTAVSICSPMHKLTTRWPSYATQSSLAISLSRSQLTTHVVKKRFAKEKVGSVVSVDGKVQIISTATCLTRLPNNCDAAGKLKLWAGNIAVHVFDRTFLESVVTSARRTHRS
ncbi:MAG: UTP--glucose-1-phosphate uridylyltransferase [Pirellulaceae bacterium]